MSGLAPIPVTGSAYSGILSARSGSGRQLAGPWHYVKAWSAAASGVPVSRQSVLPGTENYRHFLSINTTTEAAVSVEPALPGYAAFFLLASPIRPNNPEPKSQTAAGTGTAPGEKSVRTLM